MKFLADMGLSPVTVQALRQQAYDSVHLNEQGLKLLPDSEIMEKARQEQRIVLTFDLDFGELLAIISESLPSVIIFRLQNTLPVFVSSRLLSVLSECGEDLETGAIVTVEDNRYRVGRLPI